MICPMVDRTATRVRALSILAAGILFALQGSLVLAAEVAHYAGRSLAQTLLELSTNGLRIVFTSETVRPEMTVVSEPNSTTLRQIVDEILAPHGLRVRAGPRGALVVVRAGSAASPQVPRLVVEEAVTVTPSRVSMFGDEPGASVGFSRDQIHSLPHLGDDFFRAIPLAPGIASSDVSARFNVRGGRTDETLILLDGQEIYETYHLKDFDSALSFVAPTLLRSAELITGGFPVEFGDRIAGVLDMQTLTPDGATEGRFGVSALNLQAAGSGSLNDGTTGWLVEARRGTIDLVEKLLGNEDPRYADLHAKFEQRIDAENSVSCQLLYSDDEFLFTEAPDGELKSRDTRYRTGYFWVTHRAVVSDHVAVETSASRSVVRQDRRGRETEDTAQFELFDKRRTEIYGLRQNWSVAATRRQFIKAGFELRAFESNYDYQAEFAFDDPLAKIRDGGVAGLIDFVGAVEDDHVSVYASDRVQLASPIAVEVGLRVDRHSLADETRASPRLNVVWSPDGSSAIRVAWGRFLQSQRSYELPVEDGETEFRPIERAEHRVLGFERTFARDRFSGGIPVRVELYERRIENPRPRYENLFEVLNTFAELEPDRVRFAPESSVARGVETFVHGRIGARLGWFANYTYAKSEDEIDRRDVPRNIDQRHALNLDLDARFGSGWRLNLAWRYHSGWPTTPLSLEETTDEKGDPIFVPVLGPLNSNRLPDYHRLDLRVSREVPLGRGRLEFFVDVQNLYDRKNTAGFDIAIDDELGTLDAVPEPWAGILPSAGVNYRF